MALGVAAPVALGLLRLTDVAAQEATPGAGTMAAAPTSGTEGQECGAGGELRILHAVAGADDAEHASGRQLQGSARRLSGD
jgi:hypothetical protein